MPRLDSLPFEIDDLKVETIGNNFRTAQDNFKALDNRRIAQIAAATAGATDAETIQNLLTVVNGLISALNASDLTEE